MYKIYADKTLIYDSTLQEATHKIGKAQLSLETNKSGSFVFSVYPDHFYYDNFVKMKTIIKVTRSDKIIFRGRILNDVTDFWNNKVFTCEGEMGFLQDSIIRPYNHNGTPVELFTKFVTDHNNQVDDFKRFNIGTVSVVDPNNYIARENSGYESTLSNLNSRLIDSSLGGYFYITHGEDGTEEIPTINYLADFTKVNTQTVEFGYNLKDYTKTVKGEELATAIIPLGAAAESESEKKLTIESVNDGKDYIYNTNAVAMYGWIYKIVEYSDVNVASNLLAKAQEYLVNVINQNVTIELNAIDLHLIDRSIESFEVCDYIRVISKPHNFDTVMLCNKQEIDLLKPDNDKLTLGYTYSTFTENNNTIKKAITSISVIKTSVTGMKVTVSKAESDAATALEEYRKVATNVGTLSGDLETIAGVVTDNARNIATNAENIATNTHKIEEHDNKILDLISRIEVLENTGEGGITE